MTRAALVLAACAVVALALMWRLPGEEPRDLVPSNDPSRPLPGPGLEGAAWTGPPAVLEALDAAPQPTTDPAVIVSGQVLDPAGRSAEGVRIGAYLRSDHKLVGAGTSGADGTFRLALPVGAYDVRVVPDARWACEQAFEIDGSTADLAFRLRGGQALRGTVASEDGAPPTATVVTVEWNGNRTQSTTAGPDGGFRFQMPASARGVRLWIKRDERFWRVPLDARARAQHVAVHAPTWHELPGTVQTESGEYVTSGTVNLVALDTSLHLARGVTLSAHRPGTFSFEGVQAGPYVLTADGPALKQPIRRRVEVPGAPVSLKLAKRRAVSVRVTGATPAMSLFVLRDARVRTIEARHTVYEDPFTVEIPMSTDVHRVYVGSSDHAEDRFAIATVDAFTRSLELAVAPGLAIAGTMAMPAGTGRTFVEAHPIGRATQVEVAKDGSFRIGGLPPGSYRLHWVIGSAQGTTNWSAPIEAGTLDVQLHVFGD